MWESLSYLPVLTVVFLADCSFRVYPSSWTFVRGPALSLNCHCHEALLQCKQHTIIHPTQGQWVIENTKSILQTERAVESKAAKIQVNDCQALISMRCFFCEALEWCAYRMIEGCRLQSKRTSRLLADQQEKIRDKYAS